ncbi:MAG: hypothetical protein ACUVTQ_07165 [Desulfotomaculales bacterium]
MRLVRVRFNKATLYFTPQELAGLLGKDPALWARAIGRGKAIRRAGRWKREREESAVPGQG